MLAQNFMTREQLGLTDLQHKSLITLLGMMERAEIEHSLSFALCGHDYDYDRLPLETFNMSSWHCGTVGCIGGWAAELSGKRHLFLADKIDNGSGLDRLFWPDNNEDEIRGWQMNRVSVEQAAQALRNYLTLGEPRWAEVVPE